MIIERVFAVNFRTLENISIQMHPFYCTLSGQNNAGKSAIVSIITHFLQGEEQSFYLGEEDFDFTRDRTQWVKDDFFTVGLELKVGKHSDSELHFVLTKLAEIQFDENIKIQIEKTFKSQESEKIKCIVNGTELDTRTAGEILKKLKGPSSLVVHNSTKPSRRYLFAPSLTELLDTHISPEHQTKVSSAEESFRKAVERAARHSNDGLSELLGKLKDKYKVEFSLPSHDRSRHLPVNVMLTNKSVKVPLSNWGSGTQNRTRILISLLRANRILPSANEISDTPVFVLEEPESFLHPSAQAEFGILLEELAEERKIQIVATTHSPYMLNQRLPEANILLTRHNIRGVPRKTEKEETAGSNWMKPFAENLGIIPSEFEVWKSILTVPKSRVVLVEGEIDRKYFEHLKNSYTDLSSLMDGLDFVPYGGKDALRNTQLMKFVIARFSFCYVTYDLDADSEVTGFLTKIGLEKDRHFCAIGREGLRCIEGLLPENIRQSVHARETALVDQISSSDTATKKSARSSLKAKYLEEFCSRKHEPKDLTPFRAILLKINKAVKAADKDENRI